MTCGMSMDMDMDMDKRARPELRRYRKEYGHSYSFGVFPTLELLTHRPRSAIMVLVSSAGSKNQGVLRIEHMCRAHNIPFEVNDRLVERLAPAENVYAVGVFGKYRSSLRGHAGHVVLVNPSDMGNLGTIIRTMVGFEVADLAIVRPGADIFDPRVVRASMGAIFQLAFEYYDTFDEYRRAFPGHHLYPFMTDGRVALRDVRFERPFALVFGNESSGLPEEFLGVGTPVRIPHSPRIDSLSLPVAVGIGLYEAVR